MIDPFRSRTCALREFLTTPGRLCVIHSLALGTLLGDADPRVPQLRGEAVIATAPDRSVSVAGVVLTLESYHNPSC